ncbi:hypothetical protein E2C01_030827 [Portunus trituberculatus]|uniref:Uncharacterized protein n=1 Tax=Portunus trituberculatus TaxID=210409 RepID=A0A5B7EYF6_PORTR|nr:hypothetical protein [Portunus trituberculatus]
MSSTESVPFWCVQLDDGGVSTTGEGTTTELSSMNLMSLVSIDMIESGPVGVVAFSSSDMGRDSGGGGDGIGKSANMAGGAMGSSREEAAGLRGVEAARGWIPKCRVEDGGGGTMGSSPSRLRGREPVCGKSPLPQWLLLSSAAAESAGTGWMAGCVRRVTVVSTSRRQRAAIAGRLGGWTDGRVEAGWSILSRFKLLRRFSSSLSMPLLDFSESLSMFFSKRRLLGRASVFDMLFCAITLRLSLGLVLTEEGALSFRKCHATAALVFAIVAWWGGAGGLEYWSGARLGTGRS